MYLLMEKKKVLLEIIPTLANGGAESLVKEYALAFQDSKNVELKLILMWDYEGSVNSKILREAGIKYDVIYKKYSVFTRLLHKICGKMLISNYINKFCKKYDVSFIHCHLVMISYIEKAMKENPDLKIYYTLHSSAKAYFEEGHPDTPQIKKVYDTGRLTLICLSKFMENEVRNKYGFNNTITLYNGVKLERFINNKFTKEGARKDLGIPLDAYVVGNVGRFTVEKNHYFIVDRFAELLQKKPNVFLLLDGDADIESNLKNEVIDYIASKGISDRTLILSRRTDMDRIYKAMDLFFFPSLSEGFPLSIVEAQATGLKCLTSERVTNETFVTDQVEVLSLDDDKEKWVDALINWKNNAKPTNSFANLDIKNVAKVFEGYLLGDKNGR